MSAYAESAPECSFIFGPFHLLPHRHQLRKGETPVRIGSRAMDILIALVERHGMLVTKRELMTRAWPTSVVEESNLKVHVAALRKALGNTQDSEHYLVTVAGRGYQFVAPVTRFYAADAPCKTETQRAETQRAIANNLPVFHSQPIGLEEVVDTLIDRLEFERLLTVAGPGGIGKTTLALSIGRAISARFKRDVCFVDLSALPDPRLVPGAVAAMVGMATASNLDITARLVEHFGDRHQLVILDNCEHVIDAAAVFAAQILAVCPNIRIVATSREPLRVAGECVHRLSPMRCPQIHSGLTASEALQYPAVQLFIERAAATHNNITLNDENVATIGALCRRLEGVPLAIELAAARVGVFGLRELLDLLDDGYAALGQGRRTAPQRHKTLAASHNWSYQLLSGNEQILFCKLGTFSGSFTLDSACDIACEANIGVEQVIDGLAGLVGKSLVAVDARGATTRYRMLDSTRDFARRKLAEVNEMGWIEHRDARFCVAANDQSADVIDLASS